MPPEVHEPLAGAWETAEDEGVGTGVGTTFAEAGDELEEPEELEDDDGEAELLGLEELEVVEELSDELELELDELDELPRNGAVPLQV